MPTGAAENNYSLMGVRAMETPRQTIAAKLKSLGLTMESYFVPFSRSRNAKEQIPTLNWKLSIYHEVNGRKTRILDSVDYSAGCDNCPASVTPHKTWDKRGQRRAIAWECENGYAARNGWEFGAFVRRDRIWLAPDLADVMDCLISDSNVLDYPCFADWAGEYGYDPDSISAKATYDSCMTNALALRAGIGDQGIRELQELYQDF